MFFRKEKQDWLFINQIELQVLGGFSGKILLTSKNPVVL